MTLLIETIKTEEELFRCVDEVTENLGDETVEKYATLFFQRTGEPLRPSNRIKKRHETITYLKEKSKEIVQDLRKALIQLLNGCTPETRKEHWVLFSENLKFLLQPTQKKFLENAKLQLEDKLEMEKALICRFFQFL